MPGAACNAQVPAKACHPRTRERRPCDHLGELLVAALQQLCELEDAQRRPRRPRLVGVRRERVPRADFLADIATEEMVPDPITVLLRNGAAILDGEVGHA